MPNSDRRPRLAAASVLLAYGVAANAVEVSGGLTVIGLYPDTSRAGDDHTLSVDLNIVKTTRRGQWLAYVEGGSSLDQSRASTVFVESNADAGTALDPDRDGRVQLSELNYRLNIESERTVTFGLIDVSSYLDRTRITNDENVQFLGVSFVNNPTIGFPDYTLGAVYQQPAAGLRPQINAVLAGSNGLADNPNLSYNQLIQLGDRGKGAFAALGLGWPTENRLVRIGAWINTRSHAGFSDVNSDHDHYGLYGVYGRSWQAHAVNLRLGAANEEVATGSRFVALAYRYRFREHAVGLGLARISLSRAIDEPSLDDTHHVEIFGRWAITPAAHVTLSGQKLRHSGFSAAAGDPRRSVTVAGVRFHYSF